MSKNIIFPLAIIGIYLYNTDKVFSLNSEL